jgi:Streptomyces sporulation and cell division protein, SsgA
MTAGVMPAEDDPRGLVEVETSTTVNGVLMHTLLRYDPARPFEVQFVFGPGDQHSVTWAFARDLLAQGMVEPAGPGDVHIWPWYGPHGRRVMLRCASPDGSMVVDASWPTLSEFLRRSYTAVAPGAEAVDLDKVIEQLARWPGWTDRTE